MHCVRIWKMLKFKLVLQFCILNSNWAKIQQPFAVHLWILHNPGVCNTGLGNALFKVIFWSLRKKWHCPHLSQTSFRSLPQVGWVESLLVSVLPLSTPHPHPHLHLHLPIPPQPPLMACCCAVTSAQDRLSVFWQIKRQASQHCHSLLQKPQFVSTQIPLHPYP